MMTASSQDPESSKVFDFIIIGAGLAGLSLAIGLVQNPATNHKNILILEKARQSYPSRTWCFWEKEAAWWQYIVQKEWWTASFFEKNKQLQKNLSPLSYKMIPSDSLRDYAFAKLAQYNNVQILNDEVISCQDMGKTVIIKTPVQYYQAPLVFDSRFQLAWLKTYKGKTLYQQFVGWFVQTDKPIFDIKTARLMDFRAPQQHHVSFCYILPQTPQKALVEFTIFSKQTYAAHYLEGLLQSYLQTHFANTSFIIEREEHGTIPMTDYPFRSSSPRIIPIGTAGGCSKASSGYTFSFVQKHVKHIVERINQQKLPLSFHRINPPRFDFYDRVMLRILTQHPQKGAALFYRMFERNNVQDIFSFLSNQSTFWQEIKIFSRLPILLFLKMAWRELWRRY